MRANKLRCIYFYFSSVDLGPKTKWNTLPIPFHVSFRQCRVDLVNAPVQVSMSSLSRPTLCTDRITLGNHVARFDNDTLDVSVKSIVAPFVLNFDIIAPTHST